MRRQYNSLAIVFALKERGEEAWEALAALFKENRIWRSLSIAEYKFSKIDRTHTLRL